MHFAKTLPLLAILAPAVLAELDLDGDDIPQECSTVCEPIRNLVRQCNVDDDQVGGDRNEDLLERQCICTNDSFDVANVAALCASCLDQNLNDRDDLEDIQEIMSECGFQSTSYAPDATSAVQDVTVSATRPTDIGQLTTTTGPQPTDDGSSGNNNDNNNNNGGGDDGGSSGSVVAPGVMVSFAGAVIACAMLLQ